MHLHLIMCGIKSVVSVLNTVIILSLIVAQSSAKLLIPSDLKLTITSLTKCHSSEEYPVEIYNVAVNLDNGKITVTGTLTTIIDLTPPIKAILEVEKDEFGVWIEIPCADNIGSCTYDDLCIHSIAPNDTCPESFIDNNVPCRCPIPKGNYTIPSKLEFNVHPKSFSSIYSGKYWATVNILHKDTNLSCYEVYFKIESSVYDERKEVDDFYKNYIDGIFVELV